MSHLLKAAKLTADMIQRRDFMARMPGYTDRIIEYRAVLVGVAKMRNLDIADAALQIAKELDAAGHDPSMIIAALVEECEATA